MNPRDTLTEIFLEAVAASDPEEAVRRSLEADPIEFTRTHVIASGKAAVAMVRGLAAVTDIESGVVVTTVDEPAPVPVIVGGHPVPNEGSLEAARRALELAALCGQGETLVYLISGGSSALLELPLNNLSLEDVAAVNRALLHSGATIAETNTVRKHLSGVKGGRLAQWAARARLVTLVLSDVPGDALDVIGSGPTVPDPTTFADALAVLDRYRLLDRVPPVTVDLLSAGVAGEITESEIEPHPNHEVRIVASPATAARAAADAARSRGLTAEIITTVMEGESRDAAVDVVTGRRTGVDVLVCSGETTVTVEGTGWGGRNQEAALAAAIAIEGRPITFLAADTDGKDGTTEAAGAVVDGRTVGRGRAKGLNAMVALRDNDAGTFLAETGDLLVTGPTGTNVASLWLAHHGGGAAA